MVETARNHINRILLLHSNKKFAFKMALGLDKIVKKFNFEETKDKEIEDVFEMTKEFISESDNQEEDIDKFNI